MGWGYDRSAVRRGAALSAILVPALLAAGPVSAQVGSADYERAAAMQNFDKRVARTTLAPNWIGEGNRFWYLDSYQQRRTFIMVDPVANHQGPAFDHARLAKGLAAAAQIQVVPEALPFASFTFTPDGRAISFSVKDKGWRCSLADYVCATIPAPARPGDVLSPDGRRAVFVRDDNLWMRDVETGQETRLTRDGTAENGYALNMVIVTVTSRLTKMPPQPSVSFSPDSRRLLAWRTDISKTSRTAVMETQMGRPPRVHEYHFNYAGDSDIAQAVPMLIDLETQVITPVQSSPMGRHIDIELLTCWDPDAPRVCFSEDVRGYKSARIHVVDALTGAVTTPVTETAKTFVPNGYDARLAGDDLFWTSDRDGWRHLYRFDGRTGALRNRLTQGDWVVRGISHVDRRGRYVYFTAGGAAPGEDPYQRVLYRVRFDGSGLQRLTPEDADHEVAFSPDGRFFVDTHSRVDLPPVSVLRAADGRLIRELQRADVTRLVAAGWKPPERFKVKAADGTTDIYGSIFRPSNFDPAKRYPVIDGIYPGPQIIRSAKSFSWMFTAADTALAELGFIVVTIDGRGTPFRSKAFHDYAYGNMGSAGALEDHVAGLKQLATRYPELDLGRVGIYGHSGGGFASTRAMLDYPDFYKVAVSSAGNHDQRAYISAWGERYQGWPVGDNYLSQANPPLAGKLKGKLMLVHGSMDDNVSPDHTMQMANALIAANKSFDMLILPNRNHGMVDLNAVSKGAPPEPDLYPVRRTWDYFVQNLLGVTPPADFLLKREQ
ncbi:MAG: DPP IV N-terminal domain-containing protein [Sphingobium sp.]